MGKTRKRSKNAKAATTPAKVSAGKKARAKGSAAAVVAVAATAKPAEQASTSKSKSKNRTRKKKVGASTTSVAQVIAQTKPQTKPQSHAKRSAPALTGLSKMQAEMRRRLDGGKFRMLNEQLYTTTGDAALRTFQSDPELFDVYHQGFREMAEKWPVNPLDTFIEYIKKRPKAVVADFGCGDARLAETVANKVHSFDLVSRKPCVTACNIANVPLPAKSVDIAVYCLALMGTSVREFLLEAHRVLKPGGVLKVAEVKSRFESDALGGIAGFVAAVKRLGFDLAHKVDEANKMFALFEFVKSPSRAPEPNVAVELKPCEYKRR